MSEFSCVATVRPAVDAVPSAEVKGNGIESFPSEEALYTSVVVIYYHGDGFRTSAVKLLSAEN